ncbi:hypothetical protein HOK00_01075 [bacterium]|jgi:hypothetical protein|nr:hypothetical protein [bacterium]
MKNIKIPLLALAFSAINFAEINVGLDLSLGSYSVSQEKTTVSPRNWEQTSEGDLSGHINTYIEFINKEKNRMSHTIGFEYDNRTSSGVINVAGASSAEDLFNDDSDSNRLGVYYKPSFDLGRGFSVFGKIKTGIASLDNGGDVYWDTNGAKEFETSKEATEANFIATSVGVKTILGNKTSLELEYGKSSFSNVLTTVDFSGAVAEGSVELSRTAESTTFYSKLNHSFNDNFAIFLSFEDDTTTLSKTEDKDITINGTTRDFNIEEIENDNQTIKVGVSLKI